MGFQKTATGYGALWRADDKQIAYWQSRDTCPCDAVIAEPDGETTDGEHWTYTCSVCGAVWSRQK